MKRLAAALLLLLSSPRARAEAGLLGSTSALAVPGVETVAQGRIAATAGTQVAHGQDGWQLLGLPFGMALGVSRRVEVGVHATTDSWSPAPPAPVAGAFGFHGRLRFQDQLRAAPGASLHVGGRVLGRDPTAEAAVVAGYDGTSGVLSLAAGPRYGYRRGFQAWAGAAVERKLGPILRVVLEGEGAAALAGVQEFAGRGGLRIRMHDRLNLLAWGGGGWFEATPWAATGLSLVLYSQPPTDIDRDWDGIVDGRDSCRYEPEDEDGWEDEDGCPDPDNDGDGILDADDETPDGELSEEERYRFEAATPLLKMRIKPRTMPRKPTSGSSR